MFSKIAKYRFILIISLFVIGLYIRNFAYWSSDITYIFGDTNTFALHLTVLAQNLTSIFDPKRTIYFWDPNFLAIGLPTLSVIDMGLLYPPNIIIALVSGILGFPMLTIPLYTLAIFLHLIIGGIFVYKLLKEHWNLDLLSSCIGALVWCGLGFNTAFISSGPVMMGVMYLPISVYYILKWQKSHKLIHFFAYFGSLALSFLIGYPMTGLLNTIVCIIFYLIYADSVSISSVIQLIKKHILGFSLIVLPIIAPLYIPAFRYLSFSVRSSMTLDGFLNGNAPLSNLIQSFLPTNVFSNPESAPPLYLFLSLVGIIIIIQSKLLFLKDKKNILLLTIGLIGGIICVGRVTSVPTVLYFLLPGINLFRRLSIFSIVPGFVFCILVAQSVRPAFENRSVSSIFYFFAKFFVILLISVQIINVLQIQTTFKFLDTTPLLFSAIFVLIVSSLTLLSFYIYKYYPSAASFLLVLVLFVELSTYVSSNAALNISTNPSQFFKESALITKIKQNLGKTERVDMGPTQYTYTTDHYDIEQFGGYLSLASNYSVVLADAFRDPGYKSQNLKNILGIKYSIEYLDASSQKLSPDDSVVEIPKTDPKDAVYFRNNSNLIEPIPAGTKFIMRKNNNTLPRIYLAKEIIKKEQTSKIITDIQNTDSRIVYVADKDITQPNITDSGSVTIENYSRNYLKARVRSTGITYLANSTAYYPGWSIKVNGKKVKPIQTNWFMMGTYLPAGENIVEYSYFPLTFFIGICYFIVALVYWIIKIAYVFPRKKNLVIS